MNNSKGDKNNLNIVDKILALGFVILLAVIAFIIFGTIFKSNAQDKPYNCDSRFQTSFDECPDPSESTNESIIKQESDADAVYNKRDQEIQATEEQQQEIMKKQAEAEMDSADQYIKSNGY